MRKQAEQLVVGRVYADVKHSTSPTFFEYIGISDNGRNLLKFVGGCNSYILTLGEIDSWSNDTPWYELTPEEDALYNKPSEPTFTLSDIQRVIERIEREVKDLDTFNDRDFNHINYGLNAAIEIMREELKIK